MDSLVNGGLAASGAIEGTPPPVKIGLLAGGYAYGKVSEGTQDYLDQEFDSIMRSLLLELQSQDRRNVKLRVELEEELYKRWEQIAEFENWGDIWEGDQRVTRKQRIIRMVEEELNVRFNYEKMPRFRMREELPDMNVYVDPSGYVFEGVPDDRVGGVTATLYKNTGGSLYEQWTDTNPVAADRQANPQTTAAVDEERPDDGGRYGWMTPYGTFKVGFSDPQGRYLDAESNAMTVPPEHTAVNIGLLSTEAPAVTLVESTSAGAIAVEFSKYMQMDSLVAMSAAETAKIPDNQDSYASTATVLGFFNADGDPISGTVSFPDTGTTRVQNVYYKAGIYQTDEILSDWFAKHVLFVPDASAAIDP
jgi:hypothetical protein